MTSRPQDALLIARELVTRHEGLRLKVYEDTVGKPTIGYGRNLRDRGITQAEAELLLANDLAFAAKAARQIVPRFDGLDPARQAVLIDMTVNLGPAGLAGFRRTLAAIDRGDYEGAAEEMLSSRWARQVGQRAVRLARIMETGQVQ